MAITTSLQNNCSKQRQTLPGKLAYIFEKDFTIDVLLHKELWKAKIKALKGKKNYNADPDAHADISANADAEMPMPRFPNGHFIYIIERICFVIQNIIFDNLEFGLI